MWFRLFTVLAVVALGVSTWILSSPAHRPQTQTNANLADLPGYYLKNAVLTDYDLSGDPGVRIEAQRIDQIDHGNEVALHDVRVNYQGAGGQSWVLVGDTAHVHPGGKVIDVNGNVRLQGESSPTEGTAVVRTDSLTYDISRSIASTKSDVQIDFGGHTLTARGMTANLKERTMRLESRVNGRFHP
jgi:LPS export ABC transporter protein LptC